MLDNRPAIFMMTLPISDTCRKKKKKRIFVDEFYLLWFNLQEELLNGCKDLCEKIIQPKLKDYFKEIPKTPFE